MDKKQLKKERIRRYFIEAAKKIIVEQGMEALSARNIAELAGYSYATIYNYFSDIDELIWYVCIEYLEEIGQMLSEYLQQAKSQQSGVELIINSYRIYVEYYMQHPTVYKLLFFSYLKEPTEEIRAFLKPSLAHLQQEILLECARDGQIREEDVPTISEMITFMVHGMLSFYFMNKQQLSRDELFEKLEENFVYLFNQRK